MRKFELADFLCFLMVLIWSANLAFAKDAMSEISPLSFNAIRLVVASLLLWMITLWTEKGIYFRSQDLKQALWLGIVGNTFYQLGFIYGLDLTKAGNVGILLSSGAIMTALLSWLVGHEQMNAIVWSGILLSLVGVVVILTESAEFAMSVGTLWGDLLIVGSSVCWSVYTVYSKPLMRHYSPLSLTSMTLSIGALFFIPPSLPSLFHENWGEVSLRSYLELAYSCTFAIAVGYGIWFYAIDRLGSTRTAVYSNLIPFFGLLFAALFLAEKVTWFQVLGGGLILAGIYLSRREGGRGMQTNSGQTGNRQQIADD